MAWSQSHARPYDELSQHKALSVFTTYRITPLSYALIALLIVAVVTRTLSSRQSTSRGVECQDGARTVPMVPYWLPLLGHVPNMAWDADSFVKRLRDRFTSGVFALNLGMTTHNIVYDPDLISSLLEQKDGVASLEKVSKQDLTHVFGFPAEELHKYDIALPEIKAGDEQALNETSLHDLMVQLSQRVKDNIKDLVTGSESIVDQMPWERTSNVTMASEETGTSVVEANLLPLIRDFVAHTATPTLMGSDFLANSPTFFEDLWVLNDGYMFLAVGLPRWVPIPSLTRAHIARRRLLERLNTFHRALKKGAKGERAETKWSSIEDVSPLVKARGRVYEKHGFSMNARAAMELSLLWAANAQVNYLVFWLITRVYADKVLLAMLREEMVPCVQAVQPKSEFSFAEPPRLEKFDVGNLSTSCPLLRSCYIECLRLDTSFWQSWLIEKGCVLVRHGKRVERWLLGKGEYVHVAHVLQSSNPDRFKDPYVWRPGRHFRREGDGKLAADVIDLVRPFGDSASLRENSQPALKKCLIFVSGLVAMWDIEPVNGSGWRIPRHRGIGVYTTNDNTRVRVRQRSLEEPAGRSRQ